jgi:putative peptidoglycan lipid II flippase
VQLPLAIKLVGRLKPSLSTGGEPEKQVLRNFVPVVISRGVVQLSAYIDQLLASYLGAPAVAGMFYAQQLYLLPVSLFGMAISAAELPEMSSATGTPEEIATALRKRIEAAAPRIAFFVIPSVVAFLALGDVVVATLYQTGRFGHDDTLFVWTILAGSTVGLLAATQARLCSSAFYALHDTRTPLRFAVIRVVLTAASGWAVALPLRQHFGWAPVWGAFGLTASAGVAGWLEFLLLRWGLSKRIGRFSLGAGTIVRAWIAALAAGGAAWALHHYVPIKQPIVSGVVVLGTYGVIYLALALALGIGEARSLVRRLRR